MTLRLWQVLKPRLVAKGLVTRLRDAGAAAGRRCWRAWSSAASRSTGRSCAGSPANSRRGAAALEAEIYELAGERFNIGSPKQLGDILFGKMGLPGGTKTKTGALVDPAQVLEELAARGPRAAAQDPRLAPADQAEVDLYRCPARLHPSRHRPRPHLLCAGRDHDRAAVLVRAQPAEHPGPHRGGPQDPHRLHRREGQQADLGRLQPDRAAAARPCRRHPAAAAGLRRRRRHPRHDRVGDVRRAGRGHAGGGPPPRQGDQFRHHLRHLGLRPGQPAVDPARGGRRLHQAAISSASPASATTWTRPRPFAREHGYVETIFGRRVHYPEIALVQPVRARLQRARRDQRADPGLRRRHHPPRHDPHGRRRWTKAGLSARMLLQVHDELVFEAPEEEVEATIPVDPRGDGERPDAGASRCRVPLQVDARAADNWDEAH